MYCTSPQDRSHLDPAHYCQSARGKFDEKFDAGEKNAWPPEWRQLTGAQRMEKAIARYSNDYATSHALTLFFHGGLVSKEDGKSGAATLLVPYRDVGKAYPYFFVWESGPWEEFQQLQDDRDPRIRELQRFVQTHWDFGTALHVLSAIFGRAEALLRDAKEPAGTRRKGGRDHDPNTELEEALRKCEFGPAIQAMWQRMKADTADAFKVPPFSADAENYPGSKMIQLLIRRVYGCGKRPRIALIGHSTGAIYVCNFLEQVDHALRQGSVADQNTIKFDVIFIVPAVCISRFAPLLKTPAWSRIESFRMFSMSEKVDVNSPLVQLPLNPFPLNPWDRWSSLLDTLKVNPVLRSLYSSSMLYFVSGVCEPKADTPLLGLQRFFNDPRHSPRRDYTSNESQEIDAVKGFLDGGSNRAVWSPTKNGGSGATCFATEHGGFPSECATLWSVCHLLRTGDFG